MEAHSPHMDVHCDENHFFAFKQLNQAEKKRNDITPVMLKRAKGMNVSFCHLLYQACMQ